MFRPFLELMYVDEPNPKKFRKMRNCRSNEKRNSRNSLSCFEAFAINGYQMNFVRGGGDPIPPGLGPLNPGWQDDDPYTPDAP